MDQLKDAKWVADTFDLAIIDGEIVAIDNDGVQCFEQLQNHGHDCFIIFFAFSLRQQLTPNQRSRGFRVTSQPKIFQPCCLA